MAPFAIALMGAGLIMKSAANAQANAAQAESAAANARFYREQAAFAEMTGERKLSVFDSESKILYGEQQSAFAKAGVDVEGSALFMAKSAYSRQQESIAIKRESDMNVRLAMLRADHSDQEAARLNDPNNQLMGTLGNVLSFGAAVWGK